MVRYWRLDLTMYRNGAASWHTPPPDATNSGQHAAQRPAEGIEPQAPRPSVAKTAPLAGTATRRRFSSARLRVAA